MASPSSLNAGTSGAVVVTVTDADGNPAAGVDVSLGSTYGYLQQKELVTDSSGKVTTIITAPGSDGTGEVTAQVLRSGLVKKPFAATYANPDERDLEVAHASMIGDQTAAGVFNYDRFDGNAVNVAYNTSSTIQVKGNAGDSVTVTLGDSHDPNLAPLAAYYFNHVDAGAIDEDTGRYPLRVIHASAQPNSRIGAGNSMSFSGDSSKAWGDGLREIGLPQSTGFALEILPRGESGGSIVNLGQGAQVLSYDDMRFTFTVRTADGEFSVSSEAIFPARWYQVSARYHAGKLELLVNQNHYEVSATGAIDYQWTNNASGNDDAGASHDLEIAGEFNGNLDNLKWYNFNSSPLMRFEDGTTQTTVTIDTTQNATLVLNSTGKLHEHGGDLSIHRIAIHTDKVNQYASLVSLDAFRVMAGMHSEGTPLDEQTVSLPLSFMFPQANASWYMDALSLFFPIQELSAVFEQLTYAVTDPDRFEGDVFIVNLIVAATYLPPGRVLQPFARTLGVLFKALKGFNPKFLKYFGGMFSSVVSKAKKGDFDALWSMIPFFITIAEMYNDEEARKGLEFLFQTVDSGEDILSWVEYLALPAEGWDGDGEIPSVSMLLNNTQQQLPLSWMMNQAYAAPNVRRISGGKIGRVLAKARKVVGGEDAKNLPDALNVIKESMGGPGAKAIAGHLFSLSTLSAAVKLYSRAGAKSLKKFAKGNGNTRYPFPIVAATVAYLGWEMTCGALKDGTASEEDQAAAASLECGDKGLNAQVSEVVGKKLAIVFSDAATGSSLTEEEPTDDEKLSLTLSGNGHGALFHLVQTAFYQLKHRAGALPIKFMEKGRYVTIVNDSDFSENKNLKDKCKKGSGAGEKGCVNFLLRNVDIILGNGDVTLSGKTYVATNASNQPETWVELKSWRAKSQKPKAKSQKPKAKATGRPFITKPNTGLRYLGLYWENHRQKQIKRMIPCINNIVWTVRQPIWNMPS
ncbi:Ig-like domain-containing protein [Cellvibrio sp. NN19]|uniref:Ig-like domain-containing protein n=1 Tax=Cellvibrio chitinivorans TaxID=3102792 RepID=UPI002B416C0C|nr:Ig-like domain-containing protein [Cellvibrio sp. NN19]